MMRDQTGVEDACIVLSFGVLLLADGRCVKLRRLKKIFPTPDGPKTAVDDLSLTMYEGQIFALLGHNGAGAIGACSSPSSSSRSFLPIGCNWANLCAVGRQDDDAEHVDWVAAGVGRLGVGVRDGRRDSDARDSA